MTVAKAETPSPTAPSPSGAAPVEALRSELDALKAENLRLTRQLIQLEATSVSAHEARRAALNLMEDAVVSQRRAEALNSELQREVAERERAEEALRDADRRKNHFLAMLGHELRNPLAAVRGGIALLQSEKAKPETRAAALTVVAQQVAHMERLVEDLLDVTRIAEGKMQVRPELTTIRETLGNAVRMVAALPEAKGFDIAIQFAPEPLRVMADPVRLTQIFVNVLGNAVRYSGTARRIEVSTAGDNGTAVVRIRDHGQGIAPELLPRVFEPFVQAKPALTLQGGLGLGLTVVRELVAMHGGRVEAFSAGAGQGSEFVIYLPLAAETS